MLFLRKSGHFAKPCISLQGSADSCRCTCQVNCIIIFFAIDTMCISDTEANLQNFIQTKDIRINANAKAESS